MARSLPYSRVIRGYPDVDDPGLLRDFEDFAVGCRVDGGQFQVRVSRDGNFELTCSILGDNDGDSDNTR